MFEDASAGQRRHRLGERYDIVLLRPAHSRRRIGGHHHAAYLGNMEQHSRRTDVHQLSRCRRPGVGADSPAETVEMPWIYDVNIALQYVGFPWHLMNRHPEPSDELRQIRPLIE